MCPSCATSTCARVQSNSATPYVVMVISLLLIVAIVVVDVLMWRRANHISAQLVARRDKDNRRTRTLMYSALEPPKSRECSRALNRSAGFSEASSRSTSSSPPS